MMNSVQELHDIELFWHVPFWQTPQFFWSLAGVGLFLVVLVGAFFTWRYYKKRVKTPAEIAFLQLKQLQKNQYVAVVHGKDFYISLTAIIKNYVHAQYCIDVERATDDELVIILEKEAIVPRIVCAQVQQIMDGMSFIKFANHHAAQKKIDDDFALAYRIVQETVLHSN